MEVEYGLQLNAARARSSRSSASSCRMSLFFPMKGKMRRLPQQSVLP